MRKPGRGSDRRQRDEAQVDECHNIVLEQAVLGSFLIDNRLYQDFGGALEREDFYDAFHRQIFAKIAEVIDGGRSATPYSVGSFFSNVIYPGDYGTEREYLIDLTANGGMLIGIQDFIWQLKELSRRRQVIAAMDTLRSDVSKLDVPVSELVDRIDAATIFGDSVIAAPKPKSLKALIENTIQAKEAERRGERKTGILTGQRDFDDLIGVMELGDMTLLGGRPAMGKTGEGIALGLGAAERGHGVGFIGLEMPEEQVGMRAIAQLIYEWGQSPKFDDLKKWNVDMAIMRQIREVQDRIDSWPWEIVSPPTLTPGGLRREIRRLKRVFEAKGRKLELVVLDYVQRMDPDRASDNRSADMTTISKAVKNIARTENVHILALAQVSRDVDKRDNKRPMLVDLKESGQLEQDATNVVFVYREAYYLGQNPPQIGSSKRADWEANMEACANKLELIGAKIRNGAARTKTVFYFMEEQAIRGGDYRFGGFGLDL